MVKQADTRPPEEPPDGEPDDAAVVDEGAVREIVSEMLAALGIDDAGDGDGDGDGEPPAAGKTPTPRTQAAIEADVEGKVRSAITKLRGEEDRDRRIDALESKLKPEPERTPTKERVSTRLMGWGRRS